MEATRRYLATSLHDKRGLAFFSSLLPFAYFAGAILPVSAMLPLSLIWALSGKKWFAFASVIFIGLRLPDLQGVFLMLLRMLEATGIAQALVIPITLFTGALVLLFFVLDAWLMKRWFKGMLAGHFLGRTLFRVP
jgi:hypothetical protein